MTMNEEKIAVKTIEFFTLHLIETFYAKRQ